MGGGRWGWGLASRRLTGQRGVGWVGGGAVGAGGWIIYIYIYIYIYMYLGVSNSSPKLAFDITDYRGARLKRIGFHLTLCPPIQCCVSAYM